MPAERSPRTEQRREKMYKRFVISPGRVALIIFVLAVVVRLAFVAGTQVVHIKIGPSDPWYFFHGEYQDLGLMLSEGQGLKFSPQAPPTVFRTPVYPAVLAMFFRLTGGSQVGVLLANVLLDAVGCALYVLVAWLLFGRWVSVITGLLLVFHPQFVLLTWTPWSEHGQFAVTALFALCALYAFERRTAIWGLVAGLTLGMAILAKGFLIGFPIVFIPALLLTRSRYRKRGVACAAALLIALAAVVLPWTYRNYAVSGHFIPVNTGTAYAYLVGSVQINTSSVRTGNPMGEAKVDSLVRAQHMEPKTLGVHGGAYVDVTWEMDRYLNGVMRQEIREHPGSFLRKLAIGIPRVWYFASTPKMSLACAVINFPLIILSLNHGSQDTAQGALGVDGQASACRGTDVTEQATISLPETPQEDTSLADVSACLPVGVSREACVRVSLKHPHPGLPGQSNSEDVELSKQRDWQQ